MTLEKGDNRQHFLAGCNDFWWNILERILNWMLSLTSSNKKKFFQKELFVE